MPGLQSPRRKKYEDNMACMHCFCPEFLNRTQTCAAGSKNSQPYCQSCQLSTARVKSSCFITFILLCPIVSANAPCLRLIRLNGIAAGAEAPAPLYAIVEMTSILGEREKKPTAATIKNPHAVVVMTFLWLQSSQASQSRDVSALSSLPDTLTCKAHILTALHPRTQHVALDLQRGHKHERQQGRVAKLFGQ